MLKHALYLLLTGLAACFTPTGATLDLSTGPTTGTDSTSTTAIPTTAPGDDAPAPTTTGTGLGSTGEAPGTGSSGPDATTGVAPGCGDGVIAAPEQCDDGAGNDDTRYCKENCTLNICGDGELLIGWELCDEGSGNSDQYGSLCGSQCLPGARCGDAKVQPEFETCDLGANNGGAEGDAQEILCDASCKAQRLRGFVTATAFTGDLGGLFGADLKCRQAAAAAGLAEPERFHALLSTGDVDAKTRFVKVAASLPYVLVTGKKFAANFPALLDAGPVGEGITVTETGATLYEQLVATNTAPGGTIFSPDQHCQGWTSANVAHKARVGLNGVPTDSPDWPSWQATQLWLSIVSVQCNKEIFRLYCLEI
jgi:hypothetical protein